MVFYVRFLTENLCWGGIKWTIIEPSSVKIVEECNAQYIKKMWSDTLDLNGIQYDTLVHSHLMEHQYELNAFMLSCAKALKIGQRMIFTLPNLKKWLRKKYSNALSFEHTYFISDDYIEGVLNKHGFNILEKRDFGNEHSLFYAVEKRLNGMADKLDYEKLYTDNKRDFLEFIKFYKRKVIQYNENIKEFDHVYLFGAHVFSQMLVHFGLNTHKVQCILDNDPLKQGKRLYGTSLFVRSPKILYEECDPVVVLNAGAYSQEIKAGIKNINKNTIFLE